MKKLCSSFMVGALALFAAAPTPVAADDTYEVQKLFPNPNDQIGIRKVTGIESFNGVGVLIIQWNPSLAGDSEILSRVEKMCSKQPNRSGEIEIVQGFNDSTDTDENGLSIPTRSGMIECLLKV